MICVLVPLWLKVFAILCTLRYHGRDLVEPTRVLLPDTTSIRNRFRGPESSVP
jgi:hypothetical protein